jgi:hypothetical protein
VSATLLRWLAWLDVAGIAVLVPVFIWRLQSSAPRSWVAFPIWIAASFLIHLDTPKSLGWRGDNLWPATKQALLAFAIFALILLGIGFALGTLGDPFSLRPLPGGTGLRPGLPGLRRLWLYFAFCLLQQVALQSFLNNRLLVLVRNPRISSLLAGGIFAVCHWPNPVLVPTTLIGGTTLAWLFARHRNVLPLAVGQALLGTLAWVCFPVEWHHRMRVGPGYFNPL